MARRFNLAALALSAAITGSGLVGTLYWRPALSGFGIMQQGGGSANGSRITVPVEAPPECRFQRKAAHGGIHFLPRCAGQAASFDGRYFVVKNAGVRQGVGLVRGRSGVSLDDLSRLDDGSPFVLFWAPNAHRFFADQQHPGGLDRFRLFEVRGERIVAHEALGEAAQSQLRARRPCLDPADIGVSGVRWSAAGDRIVLLAYARRAACGGSAGWRSLWMIGDPVRGRIDPASVRFRAGRAPLPADGPYATL